MAKKKLESSDNKATPELDFNFDDEFSSELNQEAIGNKNRSAVLDVVKGVGAEVGKTVTNPSTYKDILRATLPKEYGDITEGAGEITGGLRDLYNQTFKELNPKINSIFKSLDRFVPESQKTLKKIVKKIDEATGGTDHGSYGGVSKEEQTEQSIAAVLGDVFDAQRTEGKIAEAKQIVRDKIDHDRHTKTLDITAGMANDISMLAQYTTKITQAYQRKDLELSARTYLANQEFHAKVIGLLETTRAQQEAIVKNTALPDYVKITKSEQFMERSRERFIDSLYGEGSALKKGMDKLKTTAGDFVGGVSRSLSMVDMGLEGAASQKEMLEEMNRQSIESGMGPMFTKAELAGTAVGSMGMTWLKDKLSEKLKPLADKNEPLKENIAKYSKYAVNPGAQIAKYRQSDEWQDKLQEGGKTVKLLDFIMEHFQDSDSPNRTVKSGYGIDGLDEPTAGFSKRAALSLTTVIPGHLAHIHREIAMLRTGRDNAPLMTFDYKMGDFTTKSKMQGRITESLQKEVGSSSYGWTTKTAAERMMGDKLEGTSEKTRLGLQIFLSRLSREDDLMLDDIDAIRDTAAYRSVSEDVQKLVDDYFEDASSGEMFHQKTAAFTKDVRKVRSSMPSLDKHFKGYVDAGYGDELTGTGLMKKSPDGSSLDIDEDKYYDFIEKELRTYGSDMNIKENIKPTSPGALLKRADQKAGLFDKIKALGKTTGKHMNPKDAYNGFRKTKLFSYFYKKHMDDDRQHDGPMAQDVRQNLGNDVAPNGKAIDVQSLSGSFFAAVKHLGDKYDELFNKQEKKEEKEATSGPKAIGKKKADVAYLFDIAKNTAETNRILASKGVVLGGVINAGVVGGAPTSFTDAMTTAIHLGYGNIKSGVIDPTIDAAKRTGTRAAEFYERNRDPALEKIRQGKEWVQAKLTDVYGFGQGVVNAIPDYIQKGKDRLRGLADKITSKFEELKDLYLPDGKEPVIRAAKIRLGFYIDEETGEPLTTMKQIMACKNNIVDKSGNILLTVEEKAQGLYDRYGEQVKSFGAKVLSGVLGIAGYMAGKAKELFKGIQDGEFLKTLKAGAQKRWASVKGFLKANNPFSGFGGMGGFESTAFLRKIYDETVNIRDILLGDKEDVMKRLKKKLKNLLPSVSGVMETLTGSKDSNAAESTGSSGGGAAPDSFGVLKRGFTAASNFARNAKDKLLARFGNKPQAATTGTTVGAPNKAGINWRAKKGAMVGDKAAALKANTSGGFFGKMKSKIPPKALGRMGKIGGFLKRGGSRLGRIASGVLSMFGGSGEAQAGNEADKSDGQEEDADANQRDDYSNLDKVPGKGSVAASDRAWNDKDGNGDRDGGVAEREAKIKALKESRTRGQAKADLTPKYLTAAGSGGVLGMAATFLSGIGDKITGLFDITSGLFKRLPGMDKILGGAKNLLGRGAGMLSNIGRGIGSRLGGQALKTGGTAVARQVGWAGLRAAAITGMNALAASGAVASTVAAAPIILTVAAVAAATYGLYRLYKYTRRDDATKYDQLRLRQYGFAYRDNVYRYNHYVYQLEDYLQDGRVEYDKLSGKAYLVDKKVKTEELLEAMDIDPKDSETISNFSGWFKARFLPVFIPHMTALNKQNPKLKLKEFDKLTSPQKLAYLEAVHLSDTSIYNYDISPVKDLEYLDVNTDDIETSFKNLIDKEKEISDRMSKAAPLPPPVTEKPNPAKVDQAANQAKALAAEQAAKVDAGDKVKALSPEQRQKQDAAAQAQGDGKSNITKMTDLPTTSKNDYSGNRPIPQAGGAVLSGSGGLEFIRRGKNVNLENINPSVLRLFLGMAEEYGTKTGKTINVNSGFRSYEQQAALHRQDPTKASKPGGTLHELGFAIDINSADANELEKLGLMKKYGFTRPVGQEPWHLEPAGIQRNIQKLKANTELGSAMVEAGIGLGGGGYGTVNNAAKSRRNHELAMSLLAAKGADVEEAVDAVGKLPRPTPTSSVDVVTQSKAANDPSYSKSQQLPASTEAGRQGVIAQDGESAAVGNNTSSSGSVTSTKTTGTGKEAMKQIITESAKRVGIDPNTALTIAAVESGFNPNAKAGSSNGKGSSAAGLMQILDGTWKGLMKKHGAKYGLDPSTPQTDPRAAALLGSEYIKENIQTLSGVRPNPNATDVYMSYFLGAGGAKKFFSQDQNQPAARAMPDAAASNRSIFYDKSGRPRTHAEIYKLMDDKMKKKASQEGLAVTSQASPVAPTTPAANDAVNSAPVVASKPTQSGEFTPPPISSSDQKPNNGIVATRSEQAVPAMKRSMPFDFDTRFPGQMPTVSQDTSAPSMTSSLNSVEGLMTKSVDIQEKSYQALQKLVELLNPEKFGAVVAQATAAAIPKAEPAKPEAKQQDQVNMGRTSQVASSSLDLTRRAA